MSTVKLSEDHRTQLEKIVKTGEHDAKVIRNAYILLNRDESGNSSGLIDINDLSKVLHVGVRTIYRVIERYTDNGLEAALERKPTTRKYTKIVDNNFERKLLQIYRSHPPDGNKWTLKELKEKIGGVVSEETIRRILKKHGLSTNKYFYL